ncbi:hypothetical protein [Burkholderia cepacia]|uniref:hypothetical protein n=1 Tax=Burkholderia cepacia TaxID=292 RepID=UPI00298F81FE|nr:hypothetical protein [Burkholderia cepacia]
MTETTKVPTTSERVVDLEGRIAVLEARLHALENEKQHRQPYQPSFPIHPTVPPTVPDMSKCGKCGLVLSPVMGYVCQHPDCPCGLGGVFCKIDNGASS